MTFKNKKVINNSEPLKFWIWLLIGVVVACLLSYFYMIRISVVSVVSRQNMIDKISGLESEILVLESEYLKSKNNITPELAANIGFIAPVSHQYIAKGDTHPGLSLIVSER